MALPRIGVLALQGAVDLHVHALERLGVETVEVRRAEHLARVDGLVLPGGESSTISKLLVINDLFDPLAERLDAGMAAFGTCAGMIMLASEILDGREDQLSFSAIDISVRRNAFGRQIDSFETDLNVIGLAEAPVHAVFIRAPVVERVGPGVEILAPFGVEDVLEMIIRPTPSFRTKPEIPLARLEAKGWLTRWPRLRLVGLGDSL